MTKCDCPVHHLDLGGSDSELAFPSFGVLVLTADYETYVELASGPAPQPYGGPTHQFEYGIMRFMQALGSPFLHNHGLRLLRTSSNVVDDPNGRHDAFSAEAALLNRPHSSGISCSDLLESSAEVEAIRNLLKLDATLRLLPPGSVIRLLLEQLHPDPAAHRRRGFDYLAEHIGDDDACELLALLTFLAFLGDDPLAGFEYLVSAIPVAPTVFKTATAAQILDRLGWGDNFDEYWDLVASGAPTGTPYIVDPLREAMRRLGRSLLLEVLARPGAHIENLLEPQLRAVEPPVIIYPSRDGSLVYHRNGIALDDPNFTGNALADLSIYGAAIRLAGDRRHAEPPYCAHVRCPHHHAGLCHRWYHPPSAAEGHDTCYFVHLFESRSGRTPAAAWAEA